MSDLTIMILLLSGVIIVFIFAAWLHGFTKDTGDHIETLYADSDFAIEQTESLGKQVAALRKHQEAMQEYINQMPHERHRYGLNPEERDLIAGVIEAEAGGEDWTGKVLIAQCLLNACEKDGIRPIQAIRTYQYAAEKDDPSELSYAAVRYVFDEGEVVTTQPVLYFYAPARCQSSWHESQRYLFTHGGHRFFAEKLP